jgi:hypothetical protein
MFLVKLVALRPLSGDDYGNVQPGAVFETNNIKAEKLESRGLAYRWRPPRIRSKSLAVPENKMIRPAENK